MGTKRKSKFSEREQLLCFRGTEGDDFTNRGVKDALIACVAVLQDLLEAKERNVTRPTFKTPSGTGTYYDCALELSPLNS